MMIVLDLREQKEKKNIRNYGYTITDSSYFIYSI